MRDKLQYNQGVVTPIDSVQTPATGVENLVKQSKPKIWKVERSKAHRKLEKVKGQAQLKVTGYKISSKHDTTPCKTSSVKGQRTI